SQARSGSISVGGQTFTVTQAAGCAYTVSPSNITASPAGGAGADITVAAPSGCSWSASSNGAWITIGTVTASSASFTVAANGTGAQRSGTMTIAGQTVTVAQAANNASQAPALTSLNPFQGTGPAANLTLAYSHPNGWAAIRRAEFILNPRWESNARG